MTDFERTLDKMTRWIAIVGVLLGLFAVAYTVRLGQDLNHQTAKTVQALTASTCQRQKDGADEWERLIGVLNQQQTSLRIPDNRSLQA